jgi:hypothetical protein
MFEQVGSLYENKNWKLCWYAWETDRVSVGEIIQISPLLHRALVAKLQTLLFSSFTLSEQSVHTTVFIAWTNWHHDRTACIGKLYMSYSYLSQHLCNHLVLKLKIAGVHKSLSLHNQYSLFKCSPFIRNKTFSNAKVNTTDWCLQISDCVTAVPEWRRTVIIFV